jgi:hypothetical protein
MVVAINWSIAFSPPGKLGGLVMSNISIGGSSATMGGRVSVVKFNVSDCARRALQKRRKDKKLKGFMAFDFFE